MRFADTSTFDDQMQSSILRWSTNEFESNASDK